MWDSQFFWCMVRDQLVVPKSSREKAKKDGVGRVR